MDDISIVSTNTPAGVEIVINIVEILRQLDAD